MVAQEIYYGFYLVQVVIGAVPLPILIGQEILVVQEVLAGQVVEVEVVVPPQVGNIERK